MKSIATFLILAGSLIPTLARATPPDVKEIEHATQVLNDCAKIADEISAMKVPAGHAAARAAAFHNTTAATAKAKITIEPEHDKFMKQMDAETVRLEACGKLHEVAVKASEKRLDVLAKDDGMSEADGRAVGAIIENYNTAREKFEVSVNNLSKDRQIQSYVHKILLAHFLK